MHYIFFHPYKRKSWGGAEIFVIRMANKLFDVGKQVSVIDYKDGFISNNVACNNIVYPCNNTINISGKVTIITFPNRFYDLQSISDIFSENINIFFLSIHPMDWILIPCMLGFSCILSAKLFDMLLITINSIVQKNISIILTLYKANALYFVESYSVRSYNYYTKLNLDKKIIPIPILNKKENISCINSIDNSNELNCFWVGRIEDFKINCIIKLAFDLSEMPSNLNKKIIFNIIGNGKGLKKVKKEINKIRVDQNEFKVNYLGRMLPENVSKEVNKPSTILFAHGTAALDGVSNGIAVVLVYSFTDKKYFNFKENYTWFFEAEKYNVGNYKDVPYFTDKLESMEQIFAKYFLNKNKIKEYQLPIYQNHCIENVLDKFIKAVDNSSFRIDGIRQLTFKRSLIWSILFLLKKIINLLRER